MPTSPTSPLTDFSRDILGRFVCNGLDEALASTQGRPDARPFDILILGGGSFGGALAQHLFTEDRFRNHRILVLEAGPFALPEHVQNLPLPGLVPPPPTTTDPGVPRNEVWGLAWRSDVPGGFPGLAYCVGGRSLFWGGWSPRLLDTPTLTEMPRDRWPAPVVDDLNSRFFAEAAEQIGVAETNDFVFGGMHRVLRKRLFNHLGGVADAIPLGELPLHLAPPAGASAAALEQLKLEAPLAVQGRPPRSGFFPLNKFSSVPLLMRVARQAWSESGGDDVRKRLMVVPNCHVVRLETEIVDGVGTVRAVHTSLGTVPVPERGVVVLAAGTIEATRLALLSFGGTRNAGLIGTNLMAHLRSNLTVSFPRSAVAELPSGDLEASALFVKCRRALSDGRKGFFHFQITASASRGPSGNSEAELFQQIPDVDTLDVFAGAGEDQVVMTIRGIGEMRSGNPDGRITLSAESDEFGVPRAFVHYGRPALPAAQPGESPETGLDRELWTAMDQAAEQVRRAFVADADVLQSTQNRDGLGTTHHEAGTLRMGVDPDASVTTPQGRFHQVVNAYVAGPALLPTLGSPNPMLSGVALARRQAEHLVAPSPPLALEPGFESLFDGSAAALAAWQHFGPGRFDRLPDEKVLAAAPGPELGLLVYTAEAFADFVLRLQVRLDSRGDNSGVFVRFRDPRLPWIDPTDSQVAANPAWIAVRSGFEAQIDELARPDGADLHRTGAIYDVPIGAGPGAQAYRRASALQPGEWNDLEIEGIGASYSVRWNGFQTSAFTNVDPARGRSAAADPTSGFLGLQTHTGRVAYRAIRLRRL